MERGKTSHYYRVFKPQWNQRLAREVGPFVASVTVLAYTLGWVVSRLFATDRPAGRENLSHTQRHAPGKNKKFLLVVLFTTLSTCYARHMILAATGHRPDKLGGYNDVEAENALRLLAHRYLIKLKPVLVISGMALGWDQRVAEASMLAGIPFVAAIPFYGQESKWPARAQAVYREIIAQAVETKIVSPGGYAPEKMQIRNRWMVDHANKMLAMWNGSPGGTANCIEYANIRGVPVDNLWGSSA